MISFEMLEADAVVIVKPSGPLSEGDFRGLAGGVDQYLESHDGLSGLMIQVQEFLGWENFSGLVQHIKFVRKHHEIIQRVALVTDSHIATAAISFANHFVSAEVRHFPFEESENALSWVKQR